MVRRLATSVARTAKPATQTRTARVVDVLAPTTDEADVATGWQVLLDFGGGEVRRAGVASSYSPLPGDTVVVARYLNTLFVIDRVTAGDTGNDPGGRVGYAYYSGATGTFQVVPAATEDAVTGLACSVALRTGAAYQVEVGGLGLHCNVANTQVLFRLRVDGPSGLDLGEWYRVPTNTAGQVHGFDGNRIIRNDNGVDLTLNVVLTAGTPAGVAASMFCTAATRPFIEVTIKGSSKLYPHAAPVPPPPELTT